MGTWNIKVSGHGIHHNHLADDANVLASKFVQELKARGHGISAASFELTNGDGSVSGTPDDIAAPEYASSAGPPSSPATPEG